MRCQWGMRREKGPVGTGVAVPEVPLETVFQKEKPGHAGWPPGELTGSVSPQQVSRLLESHALSQPPLGTLAFMPGRPQDGCELLGVAGSQAPLADPLVLVRAGKQAGVT